MEGGALAPPSFCIPLHRIEMRLLRPILLGFVFTCSAAAFPLNAQSVQILRANVVESNLILEYELLGVPIYVEAEMQFSLRPSNSPADVVLRPLEKSKVWARPNRVQTVELSIPQSVSQYNAPNLHITLTPLAYRVQPAIVAGGSGFGAMALGFWTIAGLKFGQSKNAQDEETSLPLSKEARVALALGLTTGGLGAATLISWNRWNKKLHSRGWSIRPLTISLHPGTSEHVSVDRSKNLVNQPCVFELGGIPPTTGQTMQLIVDRSCTNCKSLSIPESKWLSLLSQSYSLAARNQELEQIVLKEQRLWLSNIVPEDWSRQVASISGAAFTTLLTCDCKSNAGVQMKIIDNRTGETIWTASGEGCLGDQFYQEVKLSLHP